MILTWRFLWSWLLSVSYRSDFHLCFTVQERLQIRSHQKIIMNGWVLCAFFDTPVDWFMPRSFHERLFPPVGRSLYRRLYGGKIWWSLQLWWLFGNSTHPVSNTPKLMFFFRLFQKTADRCWRDLWFWVSVFGNSIGVKNGNRRSLCGLSSDVLTDRSLSIIKDYLLPHDTYGTLVFIRKFLTAWSHTYST